MLRLVPLVLPLVACASNVQRSARVPHPGVPLSSGQPLDARAELSAGLSNITDIIKPSVGDATQAVEVPTTQMRDELRLRTGKRGQVAVIYEHGFAGTSHKPDPTQAPVGAGDVRGYGVAGSYSFATSTPGLAIGSTVELMSWSVPYVEYRSSVVTHGRAAPMSLGIGITPSYRTGAITMFGGVFARNHPTTRRKEVDVDLFDGSDVENGPFNALLHAGVEFELERRFSALVVIHQNLVANPVQYGPGIGFALAARLE